MSSKPVSRQANRGGLQVTSPFFPPLDDYVAQLRRVWDNRWLTNNGELVIELEARLKNYFGAKHVLFLNNGTTALHLAIEALDLRGEIITTPFSYIATAASIAWMKAKPVFADIEPDTWCLDPRQIDKKISPKTTAILATHVYGNPCDTEAIQSIADKHNLKVIYDAAHAFGVKYRGMDLMRAGDISAASFHATKTFHTAEGGAVITERDELAHRLSYLRNAGHKGTEEFWGLGINGKGSELHAAMGLCNLKYVEDVIRQKKCAAMQYDAHLKQMPLVKPRVREGTEPNYAYYPVLFESEKKLLSVCDGLREQNIFPRRYFYPPLHSLPFLNPAAMPVADDISKRVLCLPLSHEISESDIRLIAQIMVRHL